jgi:hypothetical protein
MSYNTDRALEPPYGSTLGTLRKTRSGSKSPITPLAAITDVRWSQRAAFNALTTRARTFLMQRV